MSTTNRLTVQAVRDAIAEWAHEDTTDRPWYGEEQLSYDRAGLNAALRKQGIELKPDQLVAAHQVLRQRSFMGGNYTLDARAVLSELADDPTPTTVKAAAQADGSREDTT